MLGREEKEEEISETASRWQGSPLVCAACPPKAGSMSSFTNIWIQRMLEFPEIQWNTTLQNCECISGSNKKTDTWHFYSLQHSLEKDQVKKFSLLAFQQPELALPIPFNTPPKPPTALVWGLILRISKTYCKSFYVQQACLMEKATGGRGIQATPSHQQGLRDVESGPCLRDEACDGQYTVITETWRGSSLEACGWLLNSAGAGCARQ